MRTFDRPRKANARQAPTAGAPGAFSPATAGRSKAVRSILRGEQAPTQAAVRAEVAPQAALEIVEPTHALERDAVSVAKACVAGEPPRGIDDAAAGRSVTVPTRGNRAAAHTTGTVLSPNLDALRNASQGAALPTRLQRAFAAQLGPRVHAARIHTDAPAAAAAEGVGARGFTVGNHVYLGAAHRQLNSGAGINHVLAHELVHVAQRPAPNLLLRDRDPDLPDPEADLGPMLAPTWAVLYGEVAALIGDLANFQNASSSPTRAQRINEGSHFLTELAAVRDAAGLAKVRQRFDAWSAAVYDAATAAGERYFATLDRYEAELVRLTEAPSVASIEAMRFLADIYLDTTRRVGRGDISLLTDDDFVQLRGVLADGGHLWYGELRAARQRNDELTETLRVVESIRRTGKDANKLVPEWDERVEAELERLEMLARASVKQTRRVEFERLYKDLAARRASAHAARKPSRGLLGKGFDLVKGALSAIVSPFVEAGKQVVDLAQIGAHFVTFTHYKPRFISDLAAAAEQGATTTDLLAGMVKGLIETPERLWTAIENDDWEGIGRETANLYMLAKMGKEGAAKAAPWIKLVRARAAGLRGGMSADAALQVRATARQWGLVIRFRPVEAAVVKLRAKGAVAKPEFLKMKSIKEVDLHLGAKQADIGKVGYFEPKLPAELARLPADLQKRIRARFDARREEFRVHAAEIAQLEANGVLRRQGEVLLDGATSKPFTGDYDLFDIRIGNTKGRSIEYEALPRVVRQQLEARPVEVQHGAHLDWKEIPSSQVQNYVDIVLSARPKAGAQPLIEFHPDGRIRYTYFTD